MQSLADIKSMQDHYEVLIEKTKNEEKDLKFEMIHLEEAKTELQGKMSSH